MTDIITSTSQLPSISELGEVDANYQQVNSQRQISGENFTAGVQDFAWSLAGNQRASMKKSYFRMRAKLTYTDGTTPPFIEDKVAFAEAFANNLYTSIYMYAGGVDISSRTSFAAQSSAARTRLKSTGPWYDAVGGAFGWDSNFSRRSTSICQDGKTIINFSGGSTPTPTTLTQTGQVTASPSGVSYPFTLTLSSAPTTPFYVGQEITVGGPAYTIAAVVSTTVFRLTNGPVQPALSTVTVTNDGSYTNIFSAAFDDEMNSVEIAFQPGALGIWETESALPSGSYRLSLYPVSDANLSAAIEQKTGDTFKVTVEDVYLYLYTFRAVEPIVDDTYYLDLAECSTQVKTLSASNGNFTFTLPSSTYGIAVWVQPKANGTPKALPPNIFRDEMGELLKLRNIQLTYAGVSKPSTDWVSEFSDSKNYLKQRYLDTYEHAGMEDCSSESYRDWLERGPIYYWSFFKSDSNRSTEMQMNISFDPAAVYDFNNAQVFVSAFYRNLVEVNLVSGYITSVRKLAI